MSASIYRQLNIWKLCGTSPIMYQQHGNNLRFYLDATIWYIDEERVNAYFVHLKNVFNFPVQSSFNNFLQNIETSLFQLKRKSTLYPWWEGLKWLCERINALGFDYERLEYLIAGTLIWIATYLLSKTISKLQYVQTDHHLYHGGVCISKRL